MTEKQRFLIYSKFGYLIACIREYNGVGMRDTVKMLLDKEIIQKLEDLETGYYLEGGAYLAETFGISKH